MRKISLLLVLIIALAGCKDKTKFVLNGNIANAEKGSMIYLYSFENAEPVPVDSTFLSDKGDFIFQRAAENPELFRLILDYNAYMFVAENGDEITLKADASDINGAYTLEGSDNAKYINELNKIKNKNASILEKIEGEFEEKVSADPENRQAILDKFSPTYEKAKQTEDNEIVKFAMDNYKSLVSFYAINLIRQDKNGDQLIAYADKINDLFEGNKLVDSFKSNANSMKRIQIGAVAPDFDTYTPSGEKVSLNSFRGKYVLLEFWASWCQPCRAENPSIVAAYNKYKDKGFTVFGISIDKDKAAWVEAIKADGLTWTQGGDGFGFEGPIAKLYMLQATPSSFLLDKEGKIIAKNLRGNELDAFLAKTIK